MEPASLSSPRGLKIALLARSPSDLARVPDLLERVALQPTEVQVWVPVKRFHAPPGTPGPYRRQAMKAAKEVTDEEVQLADEVGRYACMFWQTAQDWRLSYQILVDADARRIASEVIERQIDVIVCRASYRRVRGSPFRDLPGKLARHLPCPMLLLPSET
jgi:nucleotide-binding universal stress UspA family protein